MVVRGWGRAEGSRMWDGARVAQLPVRDLYQLAQTWGTRTGRNRTWKLSAVKQQKMESDILLHTALLSLTSDVFPSGSWSSEP